MQILLKLKTYIAHICFCHSTERKDDLLINFNYKDFVIYLQSLLNIESIKEDGIEYVIMNEI